MTRQVLYLPVLRGTFIGFGSGRIPPDAFLIEVFLAAGFFATTFLAAGFFATTFLAAGFFALEPLVDKT